MVPYEELTEEELSKVADQWYEDKSRRMAAILGPEHDHVLHSIVPFNLGGALHTYYFPNGIPGTAIATKELCQLPEQGACNGLFANYELAMFTRQPLVIDDALIAGTPFGDAHGRIRPLLNYMAHYSAEAILNPNETCEFPQDFPEVGGRCLILDAYKPEECDETFGMMTIIEVFRSEMEFAQENGGGALIQRLKDAGHYPYSDLNREPVA